MESLPPGKFTTFAVAIGAGVVLGATGVYLLHRFRRETPVRQRSYKDLRTEIGQLWNTVQELQEELTRIKDNGNSNCLSRTESYVTAVSKFGSCIDEDDERFFDLSSSEGDVSESDTAAGELKSLKNGIRRGSKEIGSLLKRIDLLLDGTVQDQSDAYHMLENFKDVPDNASNAQILWRLAKASKLMSINFELNGVAEKKRELIFQACRYAELALLADDNNSEVHKWYAITIGSKSEYCGTKDKIEGGNTFKKHLDRAIEINPNDPSLYHLLGRFSLEIAQLSWIERKVASAIFAKLPESSADISIQRFKQAEELREGCNMKPWKENRLYLAKCYIMLQDYQLALKWLDLADELPVVTADDKMAQDEIEKLLTKIQSHRLAN